MSVAVRNGEISVVAFIGSRLRGQGKNLNGVAVRWQGMAVPRDDLRLPSSASAAGRWKKLPLAWLEGARNSVSPSTSDHRYCRLSWMSEKTSRFSVGNQMVLSMVASKSVAVTAKYALSEWITGFGTYPNAAAPELPQRYRHAYVVVLDHQTGLAVMSVYNRPNGSARMFKRIGDAAGRPPPVEIIVDGRRLPAFAGESLAVALTCAGVLRLRSSVRLGEPRGVFCLMGVCQECVVRVDGRVVNSCMEPVRSGMVVELEAS